ncbi:Ubiquitin-conjugating enzyme [Orobanche minor]
MMDNLHNWGRRVCFSSTSSFQSIALQYHRVHYHSHGHLSINPNLYKCGKSLSQPPQHLLQGEADSQVLVSIEGLILNDKAKLLFLPKKMDLAITTCPEPSLITIPAPAKSWVSNELPSVFNLYYPIGNLQLTCAGCITLASDGFHCNLCTSKTLFELLRTCFFIICKVMEIGGEKRVKKTCAGSYLYCPSRFGRAPGRADAQKILLSFDPVMSLHHSPLF